MSFHPVLTNVLKGNRRQVFRVFHLRPVLLYESRRLVDSVTIHISAYAEGVTRSNVSASRRTAVLDLNADHELAVLGAPHKAYSKIGYYLLRNQVVYAPHCTDQNMGIFWRIIDLDGRTFADLYKASAFSFDSGRLWQHLLSSASFHFPTLLFDSTEGSLSLQTRCDLSCSSMTIRF